MGTDRTMARNWYFIRIHMKVLRYLRFGQSTESSTFVLFFFIRQILAKGMERK